MTELLFQTDSYLKELQSTVIAIEDGALIPDQTIFYPAGGGQPADEGTISWNDGESPIKSLKKVGEKVLHWLSGETPKVGTAVTCRLNWQRRYQLMRTHTALHILCGVIWRDFGAQVTGGNMAPLNASLDFIEQTTVANMRKDKLPRLKRADEALARLRLLFRLSYEMRFINLKSYEFGSKQLNELGRLLGGWIKNPGSAA